MDFGPKTHFEKKGAKLAQNCRNSCIFENSKVDHGHMISSNVFLNYYLIVKKII